jgi:hypothetical protein
MVADKDQTYEVCAMVVHPSVSAGDPIGVDNNHLA